MNTFTSKRRKISNNKILNFGVCLLLVCATLLSDLGLMRSVSAASIIHISDLEDFVALLQNENNGELTIVLDSDLVFDNMNPDHYITAVKSGDITIDFNSHAITNFFIHIIMPEASISLKNARLRNPDINHGGTDAIVDANIGTFRILSAFDEINSELVKFNYGNLYVKNAKIRSDSLISVNIGGTIELEDIEYEGMRMAIQDSDFDWLPPKYTVSNASAMSVKNSKFIALCDTVELELGIYGQHPFLSVASGKVSMNDVIIDNRCDIENPSAYENTPTIVFYKADSPSGWELSVELGVSEFRRVSDKFGVFGYLAGFNDFTEDDLRNIIKITEGNVANVEDYVNAKEYLKIGPVKADVTENEPVTIENPNTLDETKNILYISIPAVTIIVGGVIVFRKRR